MPDTALDTVLAAAERTAAARTARVHLSLPAGRRSPDIHQLGVADLAGHRTHVVMLGTEEAGSEQRRPAPPQRAVGAVLMPALWLLGRLYGLHRHVIFDESGTYTRWFKGFWSHAPDRDATLNDADPLWLLVMLAGTTEATVAGRETVRQAPTERFEISIDPAATGRPVLGTLVGKELRARVWLDADGRIRRMSHVMLYPPASDRWRVTELWHFGVDATVRPPPHRLVRCTAETCPVHGRGVAEVPLP